jgi:hypothetical protein
LLVVHPFAGPAHGWLNPMQTIAQDGTRMTQPADIEYIPQQNHELATSQLMPNIPGLETV